MAGRKPKYTPERVEIICKGLSEGKTDIDCCKMAGIHVSQFHRWFNEKSEFRESVKRAKAQFEQWHNEKMVEDAKSSLVELICGFVQKTKKTRSFVDKTGKTVTEETVEEKQLPPNATAIIFALTNRDPDNWKNRLSQDVNGKIQTEQKSDVSLANVPDDLLEKVIESIRK